MLDRLLADAVAALHLAAVVVLLAGGLLAWRWPRLLWLHVPVAVTILGVNLAGADCPLTTLERQLRRWGGERPYTGGFVEHYLVQPVTHGGMTPGVRLALYAAAVLPNAAAYAVLGAMHARSRPALAGRDRL